MAVAGDNRVAGPKNGRVERKIAAVIVTVESEFRFLGDAILDRKAGRGRLCGIDPVSIAEVRRCQHLVAWHDVNIGRNDQRCSKNRQFGLTDVAAVSPSWNFQSGELIAFGRDRSQQRAGDGQLAIDALFRLLGELQRRAG